MPTKPPPQFSEPSHEELRTAYTLKLPSKVLEALNFYREHDKNNLTQNGEEEADEVIREIESALYHAVIALAEPTGGVNKATLQVILREPQTYEDASSYVLDLLARHYRRGDERPGTYWPDLFGEAPTGFAGAAQEPSFDAIRRAARAAIEEMKLKRGRRTSPNDQLAKALGKIYLRYNEGFGRTVQSGSREYGPFAYFVDLVLDGFMQFRSGTTIASITRDSIVYRAAEELNERRRSLKN